ncbi:MAG: 3'-5' exonuclease, partial [Bacteriovoracaceae bacterium]|nr:3'-5' exonuclease [Bacteriovoracaceae bacterium]
MANRQSSRELLANLKFCALDLETTGGNLETDQIIEIGMARIENLKIVKRKSILLRPEIKIPVFIQRLTSIRQKDVQNARRIEEVIDEIVEFLGDAILVAHNISFDIPFLNAVLMRLGRAPLKNPTLCTNLMTKYLLPSLLNSNLNHMSKLFQIELPHAHRALDDATACAELLLKYLHFFIAKGIRKVNGLYYPNQQFQLGKRHLRRDHLDELNDFLNLPRHPFSLIAKGAHGVILLAAAFLPGTDAQKFIKAQIKNLPWEVLTMDLAGTLLEAFIQASSYWRKCQLERQKHVLNFYQDQHPYPDLAAQLDVPTASGAVKRLTYAQFLGKLGDFVIIPHLMPKQFIIYPLNNFRTNGAMIFHDPGQERKLGQYINKHARHPKFAGNSFPAELYPILLAILKKTPYSYFFRYKNFHR